MVPDRRSKRPLSPSASNPSTGICSRLLEDSKDDQVPNRRETQPQSDAPGGPLRCADNNKSRRKSPPKKLSGRYWTVEEHSRFTEGLKKYGKDYKKVADLVGTRSVTQVRTHMQKWIKHAGPNQITKGQDGRLQFDELTFLHTNFTHGWAAAAKQCTAAAMLADRDT